MTKYIIATGEKGTSPIMKESIESIEEMRNEGWTVETFETLEEAQKWELWTLED